MFIVLDKNKRPLGHCTEKSARKLFEEKRACIYRYYPQVLILMDSDSREIKPVHRYRIKIDPGAKHTGITVVEDDRVILFMQVEHRGQEVVKNLQTRNAARRNRRNRETVYRRPKFKAGRNADTPRPKEWLPPSQLSIEGNVITWVNRLIRYLGPCDVSMETVKFDTQLMENPDIEGKEYQQGTLFGYEMKAYLMEKYGHTCQYCGGETGDHRLEWEHMFPRSRGGSDSVKNAILACHTCNQEKGNMTPEEWLNALKVRKTRSDLNQKRIERLEKLVAGTLKPKGLRYAAWVNTTRWILYNDLKEMPEVRSLEASTGGRTAYNRAKLNVAKDHHLDAMCVGNHIPENGFRDTNQLVLMIKATGRGNRLRGNVNECGVIVTKYKNNAKTHKGFMTGDIVRAVVLKGKHKGIHVGRIAIRHSRNFGMRTIAGKRIDINYKYMTALQKADGYSYKYERRSA